MKYISPYGMQTTAFGSSYISSETFVFDCYKTIKKSMLEMLYFCI